MKGLDAEIAQMSEDDAKAALKRLIEAVSEKITCAFDGGECPIEHFCQHSSRTCDLAWLDFAREDE